jgi:hypothetical protein
MIENAEETGETLEKGFSRSLKPLHLTCRHHVGGKYE